MSGIEIEVNDFIKHNLMTDWNQDTDTKLDEWFKNFVKESIEKCLDDADEEKLMKVVRVSLFEDVDEYSEELHENFYFEMTPDYKDTFFEAVLPLYTDTFELDSDDMRDDDENLSAQLIHEQLILRM
tara:strand:+ start:927 stop:1307 length:381 start_codon:yes stop_codon:yes gene_type:complete